MRSLGYILIMLVMNSKLFKKIPLAKDRFNVQILKSSVPTKFYIVKIIVQEKVIAWAGYVTVTLILRVKNANLMFALKVNITILSQIPALKMLQMYLYLI